MRPKTIVLFDIDDTLLVTSDRIEGTHKVTGEKISWSTAEYRDNKHRKDEYHLDYTKFGDQSGIELANPGPGLSFLREIIEYKEALDLRLGILTARGGQGKGFPGLKTFLDKFGVDIEAFDPYLIFFVNDEKWEGVLEGDSADRKKQVISTLEDIYPERSILLIDDDIDNHYDSKQTSSQFP